MNCPRKKTEVTEKDCLRCSFYREKKDADDRLYLVCDYDNWYPGLKKGREWNESNIN